MKNPQEYYRQLGNLMYCTASVDGKIASKEWAELRRLVRDELVPAEKNSDEFGSDAAFAVEFQFDVLEGNDASFEQALDEAEMYLRHNASLLSEYDRNRMFHACEKVAVAFHGISKKENTFLQKLLTLLQK
jgi:hypothetical protein